MSADRGPVALCYDGSEHALHAVRAAAGLLAPRSAVVIYLWRSLAELLLHADVDSLQGPMKDAARELDAEDEGDARRIAEKGAEGAREAGFEVRTVMAEGRTRAWSALLEAADAYEASVIVVGSQGLSRVHSALVGSVSAGVVHHSRRPVLLVPRAEPSAGPVVLAYDGSELAKQALREAAGLLSPRRAVVVTVWTPYSAVSPAAVLDSPGAVDPDTLRRIDTEIVRGAEQVAAAGAEIARKAGFDAEPAAAPSDGNLPRGLAAYAREAGAAAVVVGSHGRGAVSAALLGSVSRGIIHHAPAPVLVVPGPQ